MTLRSCNIGQTRVLREPAEGSCGTPENHRVGKTMRNHLFTRLAVVPVLVMTAASCEKMSLATKARTDSLTTALSEQTILGNQLQFQKDSLTRVVLDADAFLGRMDSVMKTVRGLPKSSRKANEGAIADQMAARRDMMVRVNALVA